jgi:hypothetical protein
MPMALQILFVLRTELKLVLIELVANEIGCRLRCGQYHCPKVNSMQYVQRWEFDICKYKRSYAQGDFFVEMTGGFSV